MAVDVYIPRWGDASMPDFVSANILVAPRHAPTPKPEVRSAVVLAPDGRVKRRRSVGVPGQRPARPLVHKQIHVKHASASARAEHRCVLNESVLLDDVQTSILEPNGEPLSDHGPVRRNKPSLQDRGELSEEPNSGDHEARRSASSMSPRSGTVSPRPTQLARTSQSPCSPSGITSMLARLNATLAYSAFGSSR